MVRSEIISKLFSKLNKKLSESFLDEVMDKCYIYGSSKFVSFIVNIVKLNVDPITKKKFV